MTIRYLVGALLAVAAGAVINLGILVQKKAVNASPGGENASFLARLVRNRIWLLGLGTQFLLGTPMYAASQLFIGPTLIPGLMATGLVVLALGSPAVAGEPLRKRDLAGVALVVAAVTLLGMSRLSVDLRAMDLFGRPLLTRFAVGTAVLTVLALGLLVVAALVPAWRGRATILASGIALALGNLWMGVMMAGLADLVGGDASSRLWVLTLTAVAIVAATNVLAMIWTQIAFREGRAAALMPLQQVPVQVIPGASYFALFLLAPPGSLSVVLACAGVALILTGSALVGARDPKPAAVS